jgi:hypothetical protein
VQIYFFYYAALLLPFLNSPEAPEHTLELLLVIIKVRLVAYLQTINLTVIRTVAAATSDSDLVPEQTLLAWLGTHLSQSKSSLILSGKATPKI